MSEPAVCIVGAGPAGAILGAALAERGHEVVLLDAGPRFDPSDRIERMERELRPSFRRSDVWDMGGERDAYTVSGGRTYPLNDTRVKGVGGTTLHWQGSVQRLHPEDFEMRSRHGLAEDWPISYDDLEPYYTQAEHELGVAGAVYPYGGERSDGFPLPAHGPSHADQLFANAMETVGIPLHPGPTAINSEQYDGRSQCQGYGVCNPVCPSGAKYSADVHVRKAEAAGATVIPEAPVHYLEQDSTGDRVTAATYERDGTTHRQEAETFVVAAGAIESARLLLLSASEAHPYGLANASGAVGRYFMEHPAIKLEGHLAEPTRQHLIGFETSISEAFYDHDRGPAGSMLFQVDNDAGSSPLELAMHTGSHVGRVAAGSPTGPFDEAAMGDALLETIREQYGTRIGLFAMAEQLPEADNRVTLNTDRLDDCGHPVPDLSFDVGEHAVGTLERAQHVLEDVFDTLGATDVEHIGRPEHPYFNNHHMGTTRMGDDPETSVVDADLRAHALENLYVSSSGVFVTSGAAAPTLTIAALTLRLADHLDAQLT